MKATLCLALLIGVASAAMAQVAPYKVVGDGIPQSLTGRPGSAASGRALLVKQGAAGCLQCHAVKKDKDLVAGGTKGPALDGVGAALTPAQLRLSVVDYSRVTGGTAMPAFHKAGGAGGDKTMMSATEIEDVVAYLSTLKAK
jgi:L-cysteine S-thiosulfotransferase